MVNISWHSIPNAKGSGEKKRRDFGCNKRLERIIIITGRRSVPRREEEDGPDKVGEKGWNTGERCWVRTRWSQVEMVQGSIPVYVYSYSYGARYRVSLSLFFHSISFPRGSAVSLTPNSNARLSARRFFRERRGVRRGPRDINVHMYANEDGKQLHWHKRKMTERRRELSSEFLFAKSFDTVAADEHPGLY